MTRKQKKERERDTLWISSIALYPPLLYKVEKVGVVFSTPQKLSRLCRMMPNPRGNAFGKKHVGVYGTLWRAVTARVSYVVCYWPTLLIGGCRKTVHSGIAHLKRWQLHLSLPKWSLPRLFKHKKSTGIMWGYDNKASPTGQFAVSEE